MALLEVDSLTKRFGGLAAVSAVDFTVDRHEIVGLIGPNGAGKTTVFQVITGLEKPTAGQIRFKARSIGGLAPYQVARLGLSRTFQIMRVFPSMTVLENVMVARHRHTTASLFQVLLHTRKSRAEEAEIEVRSRELIEFIGLGGREDDLAGILPPGQQRLLEIARSLATEPELLLLDEPSAGLNQQESARLAAVINAIRKDLKIGVILIEHHMHLLMGVSDRVVVLHHGSKIAEGTPAEIRANPEVITAYLGRGASRAQT